MSNTECEIGHLMLEECFRNNNWVKSDTFNPFYAPGLFRYPLKTLENLWFSEVFGGYRKRLLIFWCFQGYQKRPVTWNGLREFFKMTLNLSDRWRNYPANIYLFKVNNENTIKRYEVCLKLTIKTPVLVFLLWTLNMLHIFF